MSRFPDARILDIDLTNNTHKVKTLSGEIYRKYPGGSALGMYLLLQEMEPGIDPLSPDNLLVFSVSPLTGIPISGQSRMNVTTKSPYTGTAGDSQAGGYMPAHIKANGYDAIMFRGKAEKPVYVYIDNDTITVKDGSNAWGKVTGEAEKVIKEELGEERIEIAQIGPAGENLVKYACILNDRSRANGRNGVGAVMGSKNLKALVVKKQRPLKPVDPVSFKNLTKDVKERIENNAIVDGIGKFGTSGVLKHHQDEGFLPTRNWNDGVLEGAEKINGVTMAKTILKGRETCFACAIRCKRMVEVEGKVDPIYGGPEYETCATFGSYCGVDNLEDISYANQLCNMYGVDTISCGATIAFAMECFENGLLTLDDTDGLELTYGNSDVFGPLIKKIAYKEEGIGKLLAEGSARAAEVIGKGAEAYFMGVKKQEFPAHMPQMKQNIGLLYAVNPFGADHQSVEHDTVLLAPADSNDRKRLSLLGDYESCSSYDVLDDNKVQFTLDTQKFYSLLDTLCLCQFAWGPTWQLYGPEELLTFCKDGVGWDATIEELQEVGERRINMMRYFNAREGFTKEDDKLPKRLFEPLKSGPTKGARVDKEAFEASKERYYELAGWDSETGNPTKETLEKLSLGWLLDK